MATTYDVTPTFTDLEADSIFACCMWLAKSSVVTMKAALFIFLLICPQSGFAEFGAVAYHHGPCDADVLDKEDLVVLNAPGENSSTCFLDSQANYTWFSSRPDISCPVRIYNEQLNADNVIEVDLDVDVVRKIRAGYEADVAPNLGYSTDDICYVDPYHPDKEVWDDEGVYKSNAKWYSLRSEKTYQKYLRYVEAFGLKDIFKQTWINSDEVTVYGMFFLVRSHSMVHHIHWDWQAEINTQLITFLIPIKDIDIHLAYLDNEENMQKYEYKVGKGIGFAGGFMHGTDVGHTDTDDVLFSVYLGGDDPDIFDFWQASSADELENHMHPTKGWIRNQWYGRTQIYLPKRAKQVESNSTRGRLCLQ